MAKEKRIQISLFSLVGLEINFRQGQYGIVREELRNLLGEQPSAKEDYAEETPTGTAYRSSAMPSGATPHQLKNFRHLAELTNEAPLNAAILIVHLQEVDEMIATHLRETGNAQCEEARERFYELCRQALEDATDG